MFLVNVCSTAQRNLRQIVFKMLLFNEAALRYPRDRRGQCHAIHAIRWFSSSHWKDWKDWQVVLKVQEQSTRKVKLDREWEYWEISASLSTRLGNGVKGEQQPWNINFEAAKATILTNFNKRRGLWTLTLSMSARRKNVLMGSWARRMNTKNRNKVPPDLSGSNGTKVYRGDQCVSLCAYLKLA